MAAPRSGRCFNPAAQWLGCGDDSDWKPLQRDAQRAVMTRVERLALGAGMVCPWLFIWQGLDFTDQGYLLTGYRCFLHHPEATVDSGHMWLTNLIGALWDALFGQWGVISMRALWALCMSLGLLCAFRFVARLTSERAAAFGVLVAGVFLSDRRETWFSYNTASSLLLVSAALCLLRGVANRRPRWLVGAGIILGLAPFARFPNILAWTLVATPVFGALVRREGWASLLRDVGLIIGGIVLGVVVVFGAIFLRGDASLYLAGVRSLFAPAMQGAGYGSHSLLHAFIEDEGLALFWGAIVCTIGGGLAEILPRLPKLFAWLVLAATSAYSIFALTHSDEPWRWVVPGTCYLALGAVALGVWRLRSELRIGAFIGLVVVFVAPLGSNNGIKNAHMGLWLGVPLLLALLFSLGESALNAQGAKLTLVASVALCGEGAVRAATYTYRDGPRQELIVPVGASQLRGQYTTHARAKVVRRVLHVLSRKVASGDYLLAYEGAPLLQYLTRTRPYLNRPWLMGWERGEVVEKLALAAPKRTGCLPVAVATLASTRGGGWPLHPRGLENHEAQYGTREAIYRFLQAHHYKRTWTDGFFEILEPPNSRRGTCR